MINKIIEETGVKIDIEDDGSVYHRHRRTPKRPEGQVSIIEGIAKDLQVGDVFTGKVARIMPFGAFVEYAPGKDGMIHISKLANGRVDKVEDVVKIGDTLECQRGGDRQRRAASTWCATTSSTTTSPCPCAVPRAATATVADRGGRGPRRRLRFTLQLSAKACRV